jgi:hypothetical protein
MSQDFRPVLSSKTASPGSKDKPRKDFEFFAYLNIPGDIHVRTTFRSLHYQELIM